MVTYEGKRGRGGKKGGATRSAARSNRRRKNECREGKRTYSNRALKLFYPV